MSDRREYFKNYYTINKDRLAKKERKYRVFKRYGITLEEYNKRLAEQNHSCAICKTPQLELSKTLCVDHDHKTGEIRGLLCDYCNRGLGFFKENKESMKLAINYLNKENINN